MEVRERGIERACVFSIRRGIITSIYENADGVDK
jgi:hypothetical protein